MDVYDLKAQQATVDVGEEDEDVAADDRLANKFRHDFFESMAQRRRRPKATTTRPKTAAPKVEILRGPKLGGSRNDRQQMRDLLLKEQGKRR